METLGPKFVKERISEYLDNYDDPLWLERHDEMSNNLVKQTK